MFNYCGKHRKWSDTCLRNDGNISLLLLLPYPSTHESCAPVCHDLSSLQQQQQQPSSKRSDDSPEQQKFLEKNHNSSNFSKVNFQRRILPTHVLSLPAFQIEVRFAKVKISKSETFFAKVFRRSFGKTESVSGFSSSSSCCWFDYRAYSITAANNCYQ